MPAPEVEIRGCGQMYAIMYQGRQLGKAHGYQNACIRANAWEIRLQRQHRNCMCCGKGFEAQGRFNRLCASCKQGVA